MNLVDRYHSARVHTRRVRVLAATAARLLPPGPLRLLDIGCGDGLLAATLGQLRPDVTITGVELTPRAGCRIPVTAFDGRTLPFADGSHDAAMMVDVLHHTTDASVLMREAARVARRAVLIKDHLSETRWAHARLRYMDRVGNRLHDVALPYNYLNEATWRRLWRECGLAPEAWDRVPELYPFPANLVFGRGLHFFARLGRAH